jgi:hypothetical protein
MTFQSPNWGGRNGFTQLARAYARVEERGLLPVCKLGSREKGDENGNYMPVFTVTDWVSRDRFPDLVEPVAPALPPATTASPLPRPRPLQTVTSGPADYPDNYVGPSRDDEPDFNS